MRNSHSICSLTRLSKRWVHFLTKIPSRPSDYETDQTTACVFLNYLWGVERRRLSVTRHCFSVFLPPETIIAIWSESIWSKNIFLAISQISRLQYFNISNQTSGTMPQNGAPLCSNNGGRLWL